MRIRAERVNPAVDPEKTKPCRHAAQSRSAGRCSEQMTESSLTRALAAVFSILLIAIAGLILRLGLGLALHFDATFRFLRRRRRVRLGVCPTNFTLFG